MGNKISIWSGRRTRERPRFWRYRRTPSRRLIRKSVDSHGTEGATWPQDRIAEGARGGDRDRPRREAVRELAFIFVATGVRSGRAPVAVGRGLRSADAE
jgi:hypothetical protein